MQPRIASSDALAAKARAVFGIATFLPGQLELTQSVLAGRDALGILPTGGGKSLTFQAQDIKAPARSLTSLCPGF
jgi:ATP-dependent DNA helicase RecQ